jgi:glycosyltransferase involved in cell wall biosynthesis
MTGHRRDARVAYLVTHPIQYQVPLLRRLSKEPGIALDVFFCSDMSVRGFRDPGFGTWVEWDTPLTGGYSHEVLPAFGSRDTIDFWRPFNHGLLSRLREGGYDVIWIHGYARMFHWWALCAARVLGIPVLIRDEATAISAARGPLRRWAKRVFMWALRHAAFGFLTIGTLNREYYQAYGVSNDRMWEVPYAVDNDFFRDGCAKASHRRGAFRQEMGLASGRPVILYASKLTARKRPYDLLAAYEGLSRDGSSEPNPYLLFVGDGEQRSRLEDRSRALGWSSVRFLGFRKQSELPALYDLCDVFVLPSVDEPWGLVVNEVMVAGRPVIVSDEVGCARDLVRSGCNGCVYPARDIGALTGCLEECLRYRPRLDAMGAASREIVSRWDFEADVVGLIHAFRAAVASGGKRASA